MCHRLSVRRMENEEEMRLGKLSSQAKLNRARVYARASWGAAVLRPYTRWGGDGTWEVGFDRC